MESLVSSSWFDLNNRFAPLYQLNIRLLFLAQIKRPYFHVKPLEKAQLNNWKEYLDFEIENGTPERVAVLFERCLVACALYEEFWVKVIARLDRVSEYFDLLSNFLIMSHIIVMLICDYLLY